MTVIINDKVYVLSANEDSNRYDHKPKYGVSLVHYNAKVQEVLGEKLKAEPWMHIAFIRSIKTGEVGYVVYNWDNRDVFAEGDCTQEQYDEAMKHTRYVKADKRIVNRGSGKWSKVYNGIFGKINDSEFKERRSTASHTLTILRFNEKVEERVGAKVKAEPWMHIAFMHSRGKDADKDKVQYVIYIWDTRQVLDEGICTRAQYDKAYLATVRANDNKTPLKGSDKQVELFNQLVQKKATEASMEADAGAYVIAQSKDTKESFYTRSTVERHFGRTVHIPAYTSAKRDNFKQVKVFKTIEDANAAIAKMQQEGFAEDAIAMPYDKAKQIFDSNKQKIVDDIEARRKQEQQQYAEANKAERQATAKKNAEQRHGIYKVTFWYSNTNLGNETYKVEADSINDAFNKAKAIALRQDKYRAVAGYDHKMTFSKQNIEFVK